MQDIGYIIGVFCAIGSGVINNIGTLCQKKVVNDLLEGEMVGRNLLKKPLWIFGLFLQFGLGTFLFLLAFGLVIEEWGIGAALVPGLMAAGLIVLAIGSIKILGEKLRKLEIIGILLMVGAIAMLGFSGLETQVTQTQLDDPSFMIRVAIFTLIIGALSLFCELYRRRTVKFKGLFLAIFSGGMFAISNLWVAPLTALFEFVFAGQYIIWFIISCGILIISNYYGLLKINQAYQHGQVANLIPIQQVPIQIAPIFIYFGIFMALPLHFYSYPLMIIGVALIIVSSFLLSQRQARLEEIQLSS